MLYKMVKEKEMGIVQRAEQKSENSIFTAAGGDTLKILGLLLLIALIIFHGFQF